LTFPEGLSLFNRGTIAQFAARGRLPTAFGWKIYCQAGGLLSYGPNLGEFYARLGFYADRILQGAKPADLPVELPIIFETVVNNATAKTLGLTIPPSILARADDPLGGPSVKIAHAYTASWLASPAAGAFRLTDRALDQIAGHVDSLSGQLNIPGSDLFGALIIPDREDGAVDAHIRTGGQQQALIKIDLGGFPAGELDVVHLIGSRGGTVDVEHIHGFKFLVKGTENTLAVRDHVLGCGNAAPDGGNELTVIAHNEVLLLLKLYKIVFLL
jgi:hypothetical protein